MRFTARSIGVSVYDIVNAVSHYFDIPADDIIKKNGVDEVAYPRRLIAYLSVAGGYDGYQVGAVIKRNYLNIKTWHSSIKKQKEYYSYMQRDIDEICVQIIATKFYEPKTTNIRLS